MKNEIPSREEIERMLHENVCDIEFVSGNEVIETRATLLDEICTEPKKLRRLNKNLVCFWDMDHNELRTIEHGNIWQFHERLKPCTWCKENKPVSAFERTERRRASGGYRWADKCLECTDTVEESTEEVRKLQIPYSKWQKYCKRCGIHKPRSKFYFYRKRGKHGTINGYDRECRECAKNRDTDWWSKDNRKVQEKMRLKMSLSNGRNEALDDQIIDLILNGSQNYEVFDEYGKNCDQQTKRKVSVWTRSPQFRKKVKKVFSNKCCITRVHGSEINEACHIEPHCENQNNDLSNGLYMSRNCHALFDADQLIIDGECKVYIHPDYRNEREFKRLFGRKLKFPDTVDRNLLQARFDESLPNYQKQVEDWKRQNPEVVLPDVEPFNKNR